jgi:phthiocerol/phenolphthiocerol synthesis type-I polyketide synthase C
MQDRVKGRAEAARPGTSGRARTTVDHFRGVLQAHPDHITYRFLEAGDGDPVVLSDADLDRRARAIAVALGERAAPGDRALIVSPPGLDYIAAFLGCLYAGVIAVPVYPPEPAHLKRTLPRLLAVVADARPSIVLVTAAVAAMAEQVAAYAPGLAALPWLAVDAVPGGRLADAGDGRRRRLLPAVYLGLHGPAQGRDGHARQSAAQPGRDPGPVL